MCFLFKQEPAYGLRISDWSAYVCSSDLGQGGAGLNGARDRHVVPAVGAEQHRLAAVEFDRDHEQLRVQLAEVVAAAAASEDVAQEAFDFGVVEQAGGHQAAEAVDQVRPAHVERVEQQAAPRSEEHTSELQSLMRISYAVFCLKKKIIQTTHIHIRNTT